jgi:hypothetical protein
MDPVTLAALVTPFLIKGAETLGDKIWEETSDAAAEEAAGFGRRLLGRLLGGDRVSAPGAEMPSPQVAVAAAVNEVVAAPSDPDVQAALRLAVRKLLAADAVLLQDVQQMIEERAPTQQHAGDRSVVIGGSQSGGVNVTGDSNTLSYGGPAKP